jgi:polysaccharide deacetylase family protein (PEP-CTERM system associated)
MQTTTAESLELRCSVDSRVPNALTIDVEDYYHVSAFEEAVPRSRWSAMPSRVAASTGKILEMLAEADVRATFFILGWVADRHPELVRDIHAAGHEVGCHSYWHRLVYRQTPDEFREDLRAARHSLEDITGSAVRAYRAPSFSVTPRSAWALDVLIEEGFTLDSSIYPVYHDRYGFAGAPRGPARIVRPSGTLHEFPPPVYSCCGVPLPVAGGGYFRLYPYFFTRHGVRRINRSGLPVAAYVHPWEFDPDQPPLRASLLTRFRHYVGLRRTGQRLASLLRDFRFGTLSEALEFATLRGQVVDWDPSLAPREG